MRKGRTKIRSSNEFFNIFDEIFGILVNRWHAQLEREVEHSFHDNYLSPI